MTWATAADVKSVTGKTVTDANVSLAHAGIEIATGLIAGTATSVTLTAGGGSITVTRNGSIVTVAGTYAFGVPNSFVLLPAWADPAYLTFSESTLERVIPKGLNGGVPVIVCSVEAGAIAATYLTVAEPSPEVHAMRTETTRRDLYWLRQAVAFQAAWLSEAPDYLERNDVSGASQDGQSATFKPDALVLAPMARRALKRLSWRGTRSIRPVPVDEQGRLRVPGVYVPLEAHDDQQTWKPL